ncbi:MAG TPA: glucosidase [Nitrospiraceae bacterium]|nr:glucosidase [Nitrospiraceae bacterium]
MKEYYFYIDSTPTHSYMKYLYKYPQRAYPYDALVRTNRARTRLEMEYELIDTGVFDDDRYFDVFVEYSKEAPEDILIKISTYNRGAEAALLHVLPTLWFRNTWSWSAGAERPLLYRIDGPKGTTLVQAWHSELGDRFLYCEGNVEALFTENETNNERIFGTLNPSPYVKDGINNCLVNGQKHAINPNARGTKVSAHYELNVEGGQMAMIRLRLTDKAPDSLSSIYPQGDVFGQHYDDVFAARISDADELYDHITPPSVAEDARQVMRQALAGMLWSKQYYFFDLSQWLREHDANPLLGGRRVNTRNRSWFHMVNNDIISMPDKWEYPWYAAWDLAFHTVVLNMVDPYFAKHQLDLILSEVYMHPSGQIPAYEWNFGDVNPPVHAWATLFTYSVRRQMGYKDDVVFLKEAFQKLLLNFTWWVNRKDSLGNNIFEGGFLGLDNIGVFDRSSILPTGGVLEQADGTAWMAFYCQTMLELALELCAYDNSYEGVAIKFAEHFLLIAGVMDRPGQIQDELWDEEEGFFYDLLTMPDGTAMRIEVRSMVGLLPLCATSVISQELADRFPRIKARVDDFIKRHPELLQNIQRLQKPGVKGRHLLAILNEEKLRRILSKMLDEERFLGPHGIRSVSKWHKDHPYVFTVHGQEYRVEYLPAESNSGMFGGNSNWRGPVWMPVNLMIIRALLQFHLYYGDDFTVECPVGSGKQMTLFEVAREIADRLVSTFTRDQNGRRPVYGGTEKFQSDPHWKDYIYFYEYFHGDNGAGLGASHQTGWTGTVANLIQFFGHLDSSRLLEGGSRPVTSVYFGEEMKGW